MEHNNDNLLCWHAERAGLKVLENTIKKLKQKSGIQPLKTVYYLVQRNSAISNELPKSVEGVSLEEIHAKLDDPTDYQAIYEFVRDQVVPLMNQQSCPLHINISPGTPAMHSVWLMLSAGGAFPEGTQLWSSQFNPDTKRTSLKPVELSITTYLSEIRAEQTLEPQRARYDAEPLSESRKNTLQQLKHYSGLTGHPLLILGERGTGKTRLIETYASKIKQREVITLACGGLNSSIAESLIFGHVKGAFTGADRDRQGLLGEANNKILFLDEIQDLPKQVQRELVRTLQDSTHKYRQMGSDEEKSSDFELICASNLTFDELRKSLYPDFFDRIAHLIVEIPPLRHCRQDIPQDWQRVWQECRRSKRIPEVAPTSEQLQTLFTHHPLEGNLRDLQRLAVLVMVWLEEQNEQEAINTAIKEWSRWERNQNTNPEFGTGSWKERTAWFQQKMAHWAIKHFGDAKQAAESLGCNKRTINDHLKL